MIPFIDSLISGAAHACSSSPLCSSATPFTYEFMVRAAIACILVGTMSAVIGSYIIVRRLALMGDALSHAVLPGVAMAFILGVSFFWGAFTTGVLTALAIGFIIRNSKVKEDTAMGIMLTGALALGVILVSLIKSKSVDLMHILFGNVLAVSSSDLLITMVSAIAVIASVALLYKEFLLLSFDSTMAAAIGLPVSLLHYLMMVLLAVAIVASLQTVGIVLAVAMLITPGATAYLLTHRLHRMILLAALIGIVSSVAGLFISFHLNVSSGPAIVLVASALFVLALLFSPHEGILQQAVHSWRHGRRMDLEDFLKSIYKMTGEKGLERVQVGALADSLDIGRSAASARARRYARKGLATFTAEGVGLTKRGRLDAEDILRKHRLWETYLEGMGIGMEALHEEAEEMEHLMTDTEADVLADALGHPKTDPHGEPIPEKAKR